MLLLNNECCFKPNIFKGIIEDKNRMDFGVQLLYNGSLLIGQWTNNQLSDLSCVIFSK